MKVQRTPTFKGQGEGKPAKFPEEEQGEKEENLESVASLSQEMVFLKEAFSGITVLIRIIIIIIS